MTARTCPACGLPLADHAERWTLADYVQGLTGQGPRILAVECGRPKCTEDLGELHPSPTGPVIAALLPSTFTQEYVP